MPNLSDARYFDQCSGLYSALAALSPPVLTPEALLNSSGADLACQLGVSIKEVNTLKATTASALIKILEGAGTENKNKNLSQQRYLRSGFADVDSMLGGGYASGRVFEVAGSSSSGKTQVCISALTAAAVTTDR